MNSITLDIAGLKLELCFSKTEWKDLFSRKFSGFLMKNHISNPDMKIVINFINSRRAGDTKFRYVDQKTTQIFFPNTFRHFQLLNFAIKNSFAGILLRHDGCFIHASSAEIDRKGLLFVGVSGQGKSSVVRDLGCPVLADDRSIIRLIKGQPTVFGSPFYEQHPFVKSKTTFSLSAIFLLNKRRVSKLCVEKLPRSEAIFNLIPHVVIREEEGEIGRRKQLKLGVNACQMFTKTVPVYKLSRPLNLAGAKLREGLNEIIA